MSWLSAAANKASGWAMASPLLRGAAIGAAAGGIVGGLSQNSTFFKGAMVGAGMGLGVGYGARLAPGVGLSWNLAKAGGGTLRHQFSAAARFAGHQMMADGRASVGFLRNNTRRAYNSIRGIF